MNGAVIVAVVLLGNGCAPNLIPLDKDALARLASHSEIVAVHYHRPPPSPRSRSSYWLPTGASPIGNAIAVGILLLQLAAENAGSPPDYCEEDPSATVKQRFVSLLDQKLSIKNIRIVEGPLADSEPEELRVALGPSAVFDFKTLDCGPASTDAQSKRYSVRARLLFLDEFKVVWQGRCSVRASDGSDEESQSRRDEGNAAPGRKNTDDTIAACVDELMAQFAP